MAALVMSFIVILLFSLARNGFCACSLDNLNIGTYRSGREVGGKPEWNVVVTNCNCARNHIVLSCQGFQTVEPVDPAILEKRGDECVLIRGDSLAAGASVEFSYAWDPPVRLLPRGFDALISTVIHAEINSPTTKICPTVWLENRSIVSGLYY